MVTRLDSGMLRVNSVEKDSDSDQWEEPPMCQRMGVMAAFESFEQLSA